MNLRALLELTALISAHSPNLIETGALVPLEGLHRYWSASRAQSRLWLAQLDDASARLADDREARNRNWKVLREVMADVFAGGLVARVWGAVLAAVDVASGEVFCDPIARSVLIQHEAVRHRALQALANAPGIDVEHVAAAERIRRRLENWTDVLAGHLVRAYGVADFAFAPRRARDFGDEQLADAWGSRDVQVWDLYLLCLRTSFPDEYLPGGKLGELRSEIVQSMLASLPRDAFLDSGPLKSVRLRRLLSGCARADSCPPALRRLRRRTRH